MGTSVQVSVSPPSCSASGPTTEALSRCLPQRSSGPCVLSCGTPTGGGVGTPGVSRATTTDRRKVPNCIGLAPRRPEKDRQSWALPIGWPPAPGDVCSSNTVAMQVIEARMALSQPPRPDCSVPTPRRGRILRPSRPSFRATWTDEVQGVGRVIVREQRVACRRPRHRVRPSGSSAVPTGLRHRSAATGPGRRVPPPATALHVEDVHRCAA